MVYFTQCVKTDGGASSVTPCVIVCLVIAPMETAQVFVKLLLTYCFLSE